MHDLNAKKLKHAQAKRNLRYQYVESRHPLIRYFPLIFVVVVLYALANTYGV